MEDGISFEDHVESLGGEASSINDIILQHIRKISGITCQELTGGYWEEKPMKVGNSIVTSKTYKPDLREAYCNAVDFLVDLIYFVSEGKLRELIDEDLKYNYKEDEIKLKLNKKRTIFREINNMFHDSDYFSSSDTVNQ